MDQARVDAFLDDGWCLIGELHRWLSKWPRAAYDRVALTALIGDLQSLWATADDLELKRLARACLAFEQLLERFCSRTLEFDSERLTDFTTGVALFQDLLLGFEATREEPTASRLDAISRLEYHARRPHRSDIRVIEVDDAPTESSLKVMPEQPVTAHSVVLGSTSTRPDNKLPAAAFEPAVIAMLERFVTNLDDTCHRLHARMVMDESPYVATTSRLEHLSLLTRDLVEQIAQQVLHGNSATPDILRQESSPRIVESRPPLLADVDMKSTTVETPIPPRLTDVSREMPRLNPPDQTDDSVPRLKLLPSTGQLAVAKLDAKSHRVLVVNESLFYRHLIRAAVESAGFEPLAVDPTRQELASLVESRDFSAVLVSPTALAAYRGSIEKSRQQNSIKVVLTSIATTDADKSNDVDAQVLISRPQRLVPVLEQLLGVPDIQMRKRA